MSARDEHFGVGIYRDEISTEAIERAHQAVFDCARTLARELSSRSANETLSDAEVDLINAFAVLEGHKK